MHILKKGVIFAEKKMTDNTSLELSLAFKEQLEQNLLPAFESLLPIEAMDKYVKKELSHTRDKVYPPVRTAFSMIFTGIQEDNPFFFSNFIAFVYDLFTGFGIGGECRVVLLNRRVRQNKFRPFGNISPVNLYTVSKNLLYNTY